MTTARELLTKYNNHNSIFGVKLSKTVIPEGKNEFNYRMRSASTFANEMCLITSMSDYGVNCISIAVFYENGTTGSGYLPDDFELTILEGEELDKLTKAWDKFQMDKLHKQLDHSGSVGAHVEFFVEDENGDIIPSASFLPKKPDIVEPHEYGRAILGYSNGFHGEYQTSYNGCLAYTIDSMAYGMRDIHSKVKAKNPKARISITSVKPISQKLMEDSDDKTVALNGAPVLNAYGLKLGSPPVREIPFRAAQSGMQFQLYSFGSLDESKANSIVKTIDATLGVACVSLLASVNHKDRTKLGGLPGDYRLIPSALEYNALGNSWLLHPMLANLVFDFARKCAVFGQKGLGKYWKASDEEVISCMMDLDVAKAHTIMDRNKEVMMKMFQAAWPMCSGTSFAGVPTFNIAPEKVRNVVYDIFYNGINTIIPDISDMSANWTLDGQWVGHSEGANKNVWRTLSVMMQANK